MKYTLLCREGCNLRPSVHYLFLGKWLPFDRRYIILQHGIMTEDKARETLAANDLSIFYDSRYHVLSIEHFYNQSYYKRMKQDEELQQYVGCLHRQKKNLYAGVLNL